MIEDDSDSLYLLELSDRFEYRTTQDEREINTAHLENLIKEEEKLKIQGLILNDDYD